MAVSENSRTPQTKSTSCVKCMMYYLFVFWRVSNLGYHLFWITPMISCSYSCKDLVCDPFDVTCYDLCRQTHIFDSEGDPSTRSVAFQSSCFHNENP